MTRMKKNLIFFIGVPFVIMLLAYFNTTRFKKEIDSDYLKDIFFVYNNTCMDVTCAIFWPSASIIWGADPVSFEALDNYYSRDSKHVYFRESLGKSVKRIVSADTASFTRLDFGIGKDKKNVYVGGNILEAADAKTFRLSRFDVYPCGYAFDKNNVYYYSNTLPVSRMSLLSEVNLTTFQCIANGVAKDKNNVYFGDKKIKNADPETFVRNDDPPFGYKDKNRFYTIGGANLYEK